MGKILKPEVAELWRDVDRFKRASTEENGTLEDALVELGEMLAEQDDALIELAGIIEGE